MSLPVHSLDSSTNYGGVSMCMRCSHLSLLRLLGKKQPSGKGASASSPHTFRIT